MRPKRINHDMKMSTTKIWVGIGIAGIISLLIGTAESLSSMRCVTFGASDRDARQHFDACIYISSEDCGDAIWCAVIHKSLPDGNYCQACQGTGCNCESTGAVNTRVSFGVCRRGSGPQGDGGSDPCYCRYEEGEWHDITVNTCE